MSSARFASSATLPTASYRAPTPMAVSNAPAGTFAPGTKVQVGNHRVTIEKYLSEGGFAHVYLVRVPQSDRPALETAVLKRVAVPDKDALANMRTEVETMKKLKGHSKIVTYIDSHASQLKGGGYEVFLLMEYCSGGGLIDFMNTRLQHRLTEPEILHIFSDVAEGVATMHYLQPPLLHRDLKVENVLITAVANDKIFKLCDFGSTASPRPAATTAAEGRLIEEDIQRHTTLQYRSPEMIDVYRKQPIDEKSDIWALGVLLYKLCYYTTPFEELGQMAILNATFKYPSYPQFSDKLKRLIGWMLQESPQQRPTIYQVVAQVCAMRHRALPIKNIYANRTQTEARGHRRMPSPEPQASAPSVVGLQKVIPVKTIEQLPEITPMRRGRPTAPVRAPLAARPSPSPLRGTASDPFAALDSHDVQVRHAAADELAARFPSLDEFSLLHDRGQKFEFGQAPTQPDPSLSKRVTEVLADEAFAQPSLTQTELAPASDTAVGGSSAAAHKTSSFQKSASTESKDNPRTLNPTIIQPMPQRASMVSTGVQTSPSPSPTPSSQTFSNGSGRPIWRVPQTSNHNRTASQPRKIDVPQGSLSLRPESTLPARPSLDFRSRSHMSNISAPKSPASSRPSLEGRRPSASDLGLPLDRSKSANSNVRSVSIHVESDIAFLRDRELAPGRSFDAPSLQRRTTSDGSRVELEEKNVRSGIDFLRSTERDDHKNKQQLRRKTSQSKHVKRESITNIVKGRFGDAIRRLEQTASKASVHDRDQPPLTPTEWLLDARNDKSDLTPIAGSEATGGLSDDDRSAINEPQNLSPEMRRELEKRSLEEEERRVEAAATEYRNRLAEKGSGKSKASSKASTIQDRVKNLLDESNKPAAINRTAEGYGKYTDMSKPLPARPQDQNGMRQPPPIAKKPISVSSPSPTQDPAFNQNISSRTSTSHLGPTPSSSSPSPSPSSSTSPAITTITMRNTAVPPPRAPKPKTLQTGNSASYTPSPSVKASPALHDKPLPSITYDTTKSGKNLDIDTFSKRYPSLSGLEMVETEIPRGPTRGA